MVAAVRNLGKVMALEWIAMLLLAIAAGSVMAQTGVDHSVFPKVPSSGGSDASVDDPPPPLPKTRVQQPRYNSSESQQPQSANRQTSVRTNTPTNSVKVQPQNRDEYNNRAQQTSYQPGYQGTDPTSAQYNNQGYQSSRFSGGPSMAAGYPANGNMAGGYNRGTDSNSGGGFGSIFGGLASRNPSATNGGRFWMSGSSPAPHPAMASQPHEPIVGPNAVYLDAEPIAPGPSRAGSRMVGGGSVMTSAPMSAAPSMGPTRSMPSRMGSGSSPVFDDGQVIQGEQLPDGAPMMDGAPMTEGEPMMDGDGQGMMIDGSSDGFTSPYCNDCNCGHGGGRCRSGQCNNGWCGGNCDDDDCCSPHHTEHGPYGRPWILAPLDWLDDHFRDPCSGWWWGEDLTVFGGVHNFRSPIDLGANSNFGFQEGMNTAMPFWGAMGIGWQVGFEVTQSDLQSSLIDEHRNQVFLTTGLFHRAPCCGGLDFGAAFDWLHDDFYQDFDVGQVRGEIGYWWDCHNEIGLNCSVGVFNDDTSDQFSSIGANKYDVIDQYFFFYGRRFDGGGTARIGGGFTGNGAFDGTNCGLVGADFHVPVARCLAIEGAFQYLISDKSTNSIPNETWNLGINLVWYPGCTARCGCLPYRPLFGVADNGSLMVTRHGNQAN